MSTMWSSIASQGVPESASAPGASVAPPKKVVAEKPKIEKVEKIEKTAKKVDARKETRKEPRKDVKKEKTPHPAEVALQADIDEASTRISALKEELDVLAGQLKGRDKVRAEVTKECKAIREQLRVVHGQRSKLIEAKKSLVEKVRSARDNRRARDDVLKEARKTLESKLKVKQVSPSLEANLTTVDELVVRLENNLETSSLSIQEEKARVQQINALRKTKDDVREYHALVDKLTGAADTKHISAQITQLDEQIDGPLKQRENELNTQLSKWRAKLDHKSADAPTLHAKRRELYAKLEAAHKAKQAATKALRDKRHELYQKRQEDRARREEEQKKWIEEKKEETRRRNEERELAALSIIPHADEIALCDQLAQYLEAIAPSAATPSTDSAPAPAPAAPESTGPSIADIAAKEDVTVLTSKKSTEAAGFLSAEKAGKRKNKKSQPKARQNNDRKKKVQRIPHTVESLSDFGSLKISPPATVEQVPDVLTALATKKAELEKLSAAKVAERAAAIAKKQAEREAAGDDAAGEESELLAAFQAADTDNSGTLSKEEFCRVLGSMSQYDTQAKIDAALAKADVNADGVVSFAEFCKMASD